MTCTVAIDSAVARNYADKFISTTTQIAAQAGWDLRLISISETALAHAFAEAGKDVDAIRMRRNPPSISAAKIAGVVTFRLVRWNPIHLSGELCEEGRALKINFLAAFAFSLKHVLNTNLTAFPSSVTQEFQYTLARRHTNQETLGLAYDLMHYHVTAP